jgi:hypothetical protein
MKKAARLLLMASMLLGGWLSFQVQPVQAALIPISGEITADTVWTPGSVYYVTGSVTVASSVTLTIDAGSVVKFTPNTRLIVLGTLIANGMPKTDPVIFTSYRDDSTGSDDDGGGPSSGAPGDWGWIEFAPSSAHTGKIFFAEIRYGGTSDQVSPSTTGNVLVSNASPVIEFSTITYSAGDGVFVQSGTPDDAYPRLYSSHYTNNAGACINLNLAAHFLLNGNTCLGNGINGVSMSGRTLSGDTTWDQADLPYLITGDILVPNGSSLTIARDMVFKFNPSVRLIVDGKLRVNGEAGYPVVFTSYRNDAIAGNTDGGAISSGAPGDWGWIEFGPTSDPTSTISYAFISHGGYAGSSRGNLFMNGPGLSIDHSMLTNSSSDGIYANSGAVLTLTCNNIQDNAALGLRNMLPANPIQAANQYWGTPGGPYHSSNPDGSGNGVSDGVIFAPWRDTPCGSPLPPVIAASAPYDLEVGIIFSGGSVDITTLSLERSLDGANGWVEILHYPYYHGSLLHLDHPVACSALYFYRARGFNLLSWTYSSYSDTVSARTIPCKPSDFIASEFALSWKDNSPDESNYVIYVSTNNGTTWVVEATLPADTQSYLVNNFLCGTRQYRVRAYRQLDERYSSDIAPVTIALPACQIQYLPSIGR